MKNPPEIAVIGAGMTGLTCARRLRDAGLSVTVFDKGRGLGGRLATRRYGDDLAFDHGAQFVKARSPAFQAALGFAVDTGQAGPWIPVHDPKPDVHSSEMIVGVPGMNGLVKPMASDLRFHLKTQVTALDRLKEGWRLTAIDRAIDTSFSHVVSTVPAPQARAFMVLDPDLAALLDPVDIAPCWAMMIAFNKPIFPEADLVRPDRGPIAWLARNGSKPGRPDASDCWVAHASPDWSRTHLEEDPSAIAPRLVEAVAEILEMPLPDPIHVSAHRWRYAMTLRPLGRPYLANDDRTLLVGGDWCLGARVESAFDSGAAIADALIAEIGP
ncbi:MAG: FAD-dependent oxidoreductase [Pseudomonadota bacterium]